MKKVKSFVALSLIIAMMLSLNVMFNGFASPTGGLNGSTCAGADFDKSVYTSITDEFDIRNGRYAWPSSGTVLVTASATNPDYTIAKFNGVTIPAGLVVDFYRYYCVDAKLNKMYVLLGHFDTTDGKLSSVRRRTHRRHCCGISADATIGESVSRLADALSCHCSLFSGRSIYPCRSVSGIFSAVIAYSMVSPVSP